ncbi:hypothetical protein J4226_04620 [Candidatus Pacearchaeota archaeon]|nr:hypothetical protein [Candidatus Pacearchaeota archaeon]
MINYEILLSTAIGVIIGTIVSVALNYKVQMKLTKNNFIFIEKIKQYEKISDKINQIHEWYFLGIKMSEEGNSEELPRRIESNAKALDYFLMFSPPNFNYISNIIKKQMEEYNNFLKVIAEQKNYSEKNILKISKEINIFTNKIREQIKKELK